MPWSEGSSPTDRRTYLHRETEVQRENSLAGPPPTVAGVAESGGWAVMRCGASGGDSDHPRVRGDTLRAAPRPHLPVRLLRFMEPRSDVPGFAAPKLSEELARPRGDEVRRLVDDE